MNRTISRTPARNRRFQRTLARTLALPTLCLLSGCIVLPVPVNYHMADSRKNVNDKKTQWLTPGVTTRHDVLLQLGEPDQVNDHESQLTYRWEKVFLHVWIVWGAEYSGGGGRGDFGRDYTLELTFDPNGKLTTSAVRSSEFKNKGGFGL